MKLTPFLLLPLVFFGAGCSQSPATSPTAQTQTPASPQVTAAPDACKLFLQSDAETMFGGAKSKQDTVTLAPADVPRTQCSFSVPGSHFADVQSANLLVRDNPDLAYAQRNMQNLETEAVKDLKGINQPVSGLGDEAFWGGTDLNQLVVRKGTTVLVLTATGDKIHSKPANQQLSLMTTAMKSILSRM